MSFGTTDFKDWKKMEEQERQTGSQEDRFKSKGREEEVRVRWRTKPQDRPLIRERDD